MLRISSDNQESTKALVTVILREMNLQVTDNVIPAYLACRLPATELATTLEGFYSYLGVMVDVKKHPKPTWKVTQGGDSFEVECKHRRDTSEGHVISVNVAGKIFASLLPAIERIKPNYIFEVLTDAA